MCQNDADPTGSSTLIFFIVKSSIVKKILIRPFALFRSFRCGPEEDALFRKVDYEAKLVVQKRSQNYGSLCAPADGSWRGGGGCCGWNP